MISLVKENWRLILELAKREVKDRYTDSVLGNLWAVGHPLFLMVLYSVIFNYVFTARIGDSYELPQDLTTYILSGLIPWLTVQEVLGRSASVITTNSNLVKQIVFPVEILPIKSSISVIPSLAISTLFIILYQLYQIHSVPITILLFPILWLSLVIHMIAITYLLSGLGVYFRDLKEIIIVFNSANLFLMPVIFLPGVLPDYVDYFFHLNPFSYMVWSFQDIFYFGEIRHLPELSLFVLSSPLTLYVSYSIFMKFKSAFGDNL